MLTYAVNFYAGAKFTVDNGLQMDDMMLAMFGSIINF